MGKRSAAGLLTSVDSIFTTQEERDNAQRSYVIDLQPEKSATFQTTRSRFGWTRAWRNWQIA